MVDPEDTGMTALGTIVKARGLDGEITVEPQVSPDDFSEINRVFIRDRRGDMIPYQIETFRVERKKGREMFFVKLAFVNDRNDAESLSGSVIFGEYNLSEPESNISLPDITGWRVLNSANESVGTIRGILESPAHPIIEITQEDNEELLVPWVDEYIDKLDHDRQVVITKNLDRLIAEE